jgi:baseplate J-like protein
MTAPSLDSLLKVATEEEVVGDELSVLKASPTPFQVESWAITSVPRVLLNAFARALVKLYALIPKIAAGGFVKLAKGDWLTLLSSQNYNEERDLAGFCVRKVRVTDAGGGPVTIAADQLVVKTSTGLVFTSRLNDDGVTEPTVPASGYVDVNMLATSAGSAYNGSSGGWEQVTAIPGLTFADAPAGVTVPGTDEEDDESLANEDAAKFSRIGAGHNDDAYFDDATHTPGVLNEVSRVLVQRHTPQPGDVTLIIAGPTSAGVDGADALASDVVDAVQDYIYPADRKGRAPTNIDVFVRSAKIKVIPITGTVNAIATEKAYAKALAETALNVWATKAPIASGSSTISREKLIGKIMAGLSDEEGNDSTIVTPAADVTLAIGEIPVFDFSGLVWVDV